MSGGDDQGISADEFQRWLLLSTVLEKATPRMSHNAHREIVNRLCNGLLRARAEDSFTTNAGTKRTLPDRSLVSQNVWAAVSQIQYLTLDSLWETNTIIERVGGIKFEHYGARLEPAGVAKMLPEAFPVIPPPAPPSPSTPWLSDKLPVVNVNQQEDAPSQKGPPPSTKALAAWYEAYKLAYTGPADTEAKALESAKGCFPDKTVSREAVRKLRGEQKRGRKGEPAN